MRQYGTGEAWRQATGEERSAPAIETFGRLRSGNSSAGGRDVRLPAVEEFERRRTCFLPGYFTASGLSKNDSLGVFNPLPLPLYCVTTRTV